ncbi:hypothetical protein D9M72_424360 [compost metagenome]
MIVARAASARGSKALLAVSLSIRRLRPEASARMSSAPCPISLARPVRKRCTLSATRSRRPGSAGCEDGLAAFAGWDAPGFAPEACARSSSTSALRASGFSSRSASAAGVSAWVDAAASLAGWGSRPTAWACQANIMQHSIDASSSAASQGLSRRRRQ